jgi:hypothetical protein
VKSWRALALASVMLACASAIVRADPPPSGVDDVDALWKQGIAALADARPGDAIADFEAMGDRGVVDAVVSFDRGLAYAQRIRGGTPAPGDFGRAALGFEEARVLTHDPSLAREATSALGTIRAEVARRRALAGEPVDVDPGVPLGRAVVALAPEDVWSALAVIGSLVLTLSLFVRWRAVARRVRLGAAIALGVAGPLLVLTAALSFAARDERLHLREGILVTPSARLSDDHHLTIPGDSPLPEAAHVTIEEDATGWSRVRFGAQRGWLPSPSVRPIARAASANWR